MARKRLPTILVGRRMTQSASSSSLSPDEVEINCRRTPVGCKRSAPNRLNAPPLKKTKKFHLNPTLDQNLHSNELYQAARGSHVPEGIFSYAGSNSQIYRAARGASENICSAMADNFNLLGRMPRNRTAEEWKEHEEDEVESQVDRWACRVCRTAAVSIAVLPCSHLCLCWDCDSVTDNCPVCGKPKEEVFYIRT